MDASSSDADIQAQMTEPNRLYDSFSEKYGLINDRGNQLSFADVSSYYLLCALEVLDEDGKLERKADMFTKRTIKPHEAVTTVDTTSEALAISISEKARVDMTYMEQLTGKTGEELAVELRGVIFRVPGQNEPNGQPHYVTADEYLFGNVRQKLRLAQRAAEQFTIKQLERTRKSLEAPASIKRGRMSLDQNQQKPRSVTSRTFVSSHNVCFLRVAFFD